MKISRIEIYRVAMPLVYPFRTAFGDDETIESVLVRLCAGNACGWGEAAPWRNPGYCPECAATQFMISKQFLAPLLLGMTSNRASNFSSVSLRSRAIRLPRQPFDLAWWDLYARSLDQPLWKVLGGTNPTVDVGADFALWRLLIDS